MSHDNSNDPQPEDPLSKVVVRLREEGVDFFLNTTLEPIVSSREDYFQQFWPSNSERVKDLVLVTYYEVNGRLMSRAELMQLMAMLREECRIGGRRATDI